MARRPHLDPRQDSYPTPRTQAREMTGDGRIDLAGIGGMRKQIGERDGQQPAASFQLLRPMAVGQQSEVADALETPRQSVQQELADELFGGQSRDLGALRVAIVFPAERNLTFFAGRA